MLTGLMSTALVAGPQGILAIEEITEQARELRPLVRAVVACVLRERPDHADVEDCTSEVLRRALESTTGPKGPLRPWLLGIARHVALDNLRARQRQRARTPTESADESATSVIEQLVDPSAPADAQLERVERAARVRRVLATLPDGSRQALELFHLEGLSYQEIAVRLAVPLGTVATWVARGRRAMAELLEEDHVGGGQ